jgi:NADPH2:quinone reductase
VSMGNFSILGVILGYGELPVDFRRFGLNMFGAEVGREVHAALLELVSARSVRPVVGRTITMDQVAAALDDHERRRTIGRTVVRVAGD